MSVNIFNKSTGSIAQIAGNATGSGGGTTVTVDNILSTTSENPVQNKVITEELNKKIDSSIKGAANGVAELDSNGKVLTAQLPSYVDDVLEYTDISVFPTVGETGKIYVDRERQLEFLTVGDYGKENNIKADFLGLHKEINGVKNNVGRTE